jgi:predicted HTH transcriptional regulator
VKFLAAEVVAFSNTNGGMILIGVNDAQQVVGLLKETDFGNRTIGNRKGKSLC